MRTVTTSRLRALRAAHAVTLGSAVLFVACGTESGDPVADGGSDAAADSGGGDVAADVAADSAPSDTGSDTTAPDTASDTGAPDTAQPDTAADTAPDVAPDTAEDTSPDVAADTSEDVPEPDVTDVIDDTATDAADTGADADPDAAGPGCKDFEDNVCPVDCLPDNDYDCCIADGPDGWCNFDPSYGCICAVEGPFAPPSLPATRATPRAIPRELL